MFLRGCTRETFYELCFVRIVYFFIYNIASTLHQFACKEGTNKGKLKTTKNDDDADDDNVVKCSNSVMIEGC